MYSRRCLGWVGVCGMVLTCSMARADDMGTAFTYQGYLEKPAGTPLSATCNFQFSLWDGPIVPPANQVGSGLLFDGQPGNEPPIAIIDGVFTANLDFGSGIFNGQARWLWIWVQCAGDPGYVQLNPRVELTPAPYAMWAAEGVGPPGVLEVTPTGELNLTKDLGAGMANHLLFDANNWTMAASSDTGTALMKIESRGPPGYKTQLLLDDATSSVTIAGEVPPPNTAGITPPPKLRISLEAAPANAAAVGDYVSIAAYADDGVTAVPLRLNSGDPNTMNVTPTGRVGIGTEAPSERLDVAGNIHASGTITSGSSIEIDGILHTICSDGTLALQTAPACTTRIFLDAPSGNVGIGTNAPKAALDVASGRVIVRDRGTPPTTGTGMELGYNPATELGFIQVLDRDTMAWKDLYLGNSNIRWGESILTTDQLGSIELGPEAGSAGGETAYIDMHYGSGVAQDYSVRIIAYGENDLLFQAADIGNVLALSDGKIGVGTPNPQAKLHVVGTPGVDGIMFPDGTLQTSALGGGGGGGTLDDAYDFGGAGLGRTIAADAGPMNIAGPDGLTVLGTIKSGSSITIDGTQSTDQITSTEDALEIHVGVSRVLRVETHAYRPNIIGGHNSNAVSLPLGAWGATISGGWDNTASGVGTTIAGGSSNNAVFQGSTIGGGEANETLFYYSTVAGGVYNTASGNYSTVPGGASNTAGGDYSFAAGRQGKVRTATQVGGGDTDGDQGTFVWADSTAADFISSGTNQFLIRASGGVGMGTASATAPRAQLDVVKSGASVAVFDRTTSDGTIISLRQAGVEEGTISVSGTTVSYNAFTGSHYGWTDETIARGTLVTLTGENQRRTADPGTEPTYGIAPTTKANDPKCLGAYLGLLEPSKAAAMENPHQVMAVGNGDMWVVDTGRNIEPGQYLISSDVRGHAMLDDAERFPVGHVVARAGEVVDWSKVNEYVDGRKHKRTSVFFESFERGSAVGLGKIVEQQQLRIEELSRRLSELEAARGGTQ